MFSDRRQVAAAVKQLMLNVSEFGFHITAILTIIKLRKRKPDKAVQLINRPVAFNPQTVFIRSAADQAVCPLSPVFVYSFIVVFLLLPPLLHMPRFLF